MARGQTDAHRQRRRHRGDSRGRHRVAGQQQSPRATWVSDRYQAVGVVHPMTVGPIRTVEPVRTLAAVHGVLPPHKYPQDELTELFAGLCVPDAKSHPLVRRLPGSVRVATRHLARPIERDPELRRFTEANNAFLEVAVELGAQAATPAARRSSRPSRARSDSRNTICT